MGELFVGIILYEIIMASNFILIVFMKRTTP